jgi:hypothetical protein
MPWKKASLLAVYLACRALTFAAGSTRLRMGLM